MSGADYGGIRGIRWLLELGEGERGRVVSSLSAEALGELAQHWPLWAHVGQLPPPGDWRVWLLQAGRGFGKTRAGAQWVGAMARAVPGARIALVGATIEDARKVMVAGPSGVVAVARDDDAVVWRPSSGEVRFGNGAVATLYSAAAPEKLRGPEHHFAWADELAKWSHASAWDNLTMGLRLGALPRVLVTTTPRSTTLMRQVRAGLGAARGFRLRDPFDWRVTAETIGTGDGVMRQFALVRRYDAATRRITRPVAGSVRVAVGGVATSGFTLSAGGLITLDAAPAAGAVVTASFDFDVPVRFAEDQLRVTRATYLAGAASSVPLIEVRES